jgi:hypothetical protein
MDLNAQNVCRAMPNTVLILSCREQWCRARVVCETQAPTHRQFVTWSNSLIQVNQENVLVRNWGIQSYVSICTLEAGRALRLIACDRIVIAQV